MGGADINPQAHAGGYVDELTIVVVLVILGGCSRLAPAAAAGAASGRTGA